MILSIQYKCKNGHESPFHYSDYCYWCWQKGKKVKLQKIREVMKDE